MPNIFDSNIDLSNIASSFTPAVTTGLTTYALLGKSLQASLYNYANPSSPLMTNSSAGPTFLPSVTPGVSGLTVNGGPGPTFEGGQVILPDAPSVGSETIFFVASTNPSSWAAFVCEFLGVWNGTAGTLNQAFYIQASNQLTGVQCSVGYINGAGTASSISLATWVNTGALGTTSTEQAIVATPQLYMFKFDIPNLLVTFENMTQSSIIGAPATTKHTAVLTAGSTRPVITSNINILGTIQAPENASVTHHAYLHYNRATLASEDALIYAQLQKIMAVRGFTI